MKYIERFMSLTLYEKTVFTGTMGLCLYGTLSRDGIYVFVGLVLFGTLLVGWNDPAVPAEYREILDEQLTKIRAAQEASGIRLQPQEEIAEAIKLADEELKRRQEWKDATKAE